MLCAMHSPPVDRFEARMHPASADGQGRTQRSMRRCSSDRMCEAQFGLCCWRLLDSISRSMSLAETSLPAPLQSRDAARPSDTHSEKATSEYVEMIRGNEEVREARGADNAGNDARDDSHTNAVSPFSSWMLISAPALAAFS